MAKSKQQKRKEKKKRERQHRVRKEARMKRDAARTSKVKRERATQRMMQHIEKDDLVQQLLENYRQKVHNDAMANPWAQHKTPPHAYAIPPEETEEFWQRENEAAEQRESEETSE